MSENVKAVPTLIISVQIGKDSPATPLSVPIAKELLDELTKALAAIEGPPSEPEAPTEAT